MRIWISLLTLTALAWAEGDTPAPGDVEVHKELDAKEVAKRLGSKDVTERYEATQQAANIQDSCVVAPLTKLLKDKEEAVRLGAIEALRVRHEEKDKRKAAQSLANRLKPLAGNESDRPELIKICNALHDLAQKGSIKPLLTNVPSDAHQEEIRARLKAVANVPHADAIEAIFRFASSGRKHAKRSKWAQQALAYATGEKENKRLDDWRRWWTENKRTFDFEAAAEMRAEKRAADAEKEAKRKKKRKKRRGDLGQE